MDEVIWIEVLSRHRSVLSRHRCEGRTIHIGRAYTNDIILDDPYVAPEHAVIARDEAGGFAVEDIGSANGLFARQGRDRRRSIALDDDTVFRVGHTYLRARRTGHAVAPERRIAHQGRTWIALLGLAIVVLGAEALSLYLADFAEMRAANYLVPLLGGGVAIGVWAAGWSMVTRLFAGAARFERNLLIALLGAFGFEAIGAASALGAFGLSWSTLANYNYVAIYCLAAVVCFTHLRLINPTRSAAAGAVMAGLLLMALGIQIAVQRDDRPFVGQLYVRNLLPQALRLAPVRDEAAFFRRIETLRGKLDEDRTQDP